MPCCRTAATVYIARFRFSTCCWFFSSLPAAALPCLLPPPGLTNSAYWFAAFLRTLTPQTRREHKRAWFTLRSACLRCTAARAYGSPCRSTRLVSLPYWHTVLRLVLPALPFTYHHLPTRVLLPPCCCPGPLPACRTTATALITRLTPGSSCSNTVAPGSSSYAWFWVRSPGSLRSAWMPLTYSCQTQFVSPRLPSRFCARCRIACLPRLPPATRPCYFTQLGGSAPGWIWFYHSHLPYTPAARSWFRKPACLPPRDGFSPCLRITSAATLPAVCKNITLAVPRFAATPNAVYCWIAFWFPCVLVLLSSYLTEHLHLPAACRTSAFRVLGCRTVPLPAGLPCLLPYA